MYALDNQTAPCVIRHVQIQCHHIVPPVRVKTTFVSTTHQDVSQLAKRAVALENSTVLAEACVSIRMVALRHLLLTRREPAKYRLLEHNRAAAFEELSVFPTPCVPILTEQPGPRPLMQWEPVDLLFKHALRRHQRLFGQPKPDA